MQALWLLTFYVLQYVLIYFNLKLMGHIYGIPLAFDAYVIICMIFAMFNPGALWRTFGDHNAAILWNMHLHPERTQDQCSATALNATVFDYALRVLWLLCIFVALNVWLNFGVF